MTRRMGFTTTMRRIYLAAGQGVMHRCPGWVLSELRMGYFIRDETLEYRGRKKPKKVLKHKKTQKLYGN
jgi:hypothetical protein